MKPVWRSEICKHVNDGTDCVARGVFDLFSLQGGLLRSIKIKFMVG